MKPATLVYINNTDEREHYRLLQVIEEKRGRIVELTSDIHNLKAEVDSFQRHYHAYIGHYYLELDKVELEMKEYRLRLQLRKEKVNTEQIEMRVESCFRVNRARVTEKGNKEESQQLSEMGKLPTAKAKHLQTLYRNLAKQYHPDKTRDIEEQELRKQLMPLINRAYREKDVQTLERLSLGRIDLTESSKEVFGEKRARLQAELRRLNRATSELQLEINRLKAGRIYQLKQQFETATESGGDILTTLGEELGQKLQASRARLARLIHTWHRSTA